MRLVWNTTLWATALVLTQAGPAAAGVPSRFSVSGVLRDGAGALQSMQVGVVVSLFDAPSGGSRLRVYGPTQVQPKGGVFTVAFQDPELLTWLIQSQEIWLELAVEGEALDRQLITSHFYAFVAQHAAEADHASAADHATIADGLSGACSGCVTGHELAEASVSAAHVAPGALTHQHTPSVRRTDALPVLIPVPPGGVVDAFSVPCNPDEITIGGACLNNNDDTHVVEFATPGGPGNWFRCRYKNTGTATTVLADPRAMCLKIAAAL
jgi:hypothetical protein